MPRVLMVAFHYPPCAVSSGIQRTLRFSQYLPDAGWEPMVLTAHPRVYERTSDQQLRDIPPGTIVARAFALDTGRHLALRGRYPGALAVPDRFVTWWAGGVIAGLRLVRRHRPDVLWSTYPIATAQLIAATLHRLTGLPWVADFRDSMVDEKFPADPARRRSHIAIERAVVTRAARLVVTTASARERYLRKFPALANRVDLISNGYDESDFVPLEGARPAPASGRPLRLVHSGLIDPGDRDPRTFFRAVARLKQDGALTAADVRITLRATGADGLYAPQLRELGIEDVIELAPPLPYRDALREVLEADGLLLLQGAVCNHQIPAKAYEYLRAGRPLLALTHEAGDTAGLLREAGGATIVDLDDEDAIRRGLPAFVARVKQTAHPAPDRTVVERYDRHNQAHALARILSGVKGTP